MFSADKPLYQLLKNLAGGRVYAMRAPQNTPAPFIVFQEVDSSRWRSINGPTGFAQASFQVDSYATTLYAAKELALSVESIIDGYSGSVAINTDSPTVFVKIGGISYQNGIDLLDQTEEPLLYRRSDNYLVTYEQE